MTIDDETLMAYADGALDARAAAEVEQALRSDPAIARRVEDFRRVAARVREAQQSVLAEPVPLRLLAAARRRDDARTPARSFAWQGFAMAASLLLGVALTWALVRPGAQPSIRPSADGLVAGGALERALSSDLPGAAAGDAAVRVGLSFRDGDGHYCRTFRIEGVAGLACRGDGGWHVEAAASDAAAGGADYRMASSSLPAAIRSAIEERIEGEPLDAEQERSARDRGWSDSR